MLSIGTYEIILIALLVLIFVKPEDLPDLLEKLGGFYSKAKSHIVNIRSEISGSIEDIKDAKLEIEREMKESFDFEKELENISKEFKQSSKSNFSKSKDPSLKIEGEIPDEKEVQKELDLIMGEDSDEK
ncbi:MAG: hypothetical protein N4A44_02395 [Alphaproteobacteria bacterium]|jgi:Sec-independent protein translocase protein TatA|nr:hypothetical protein [Alphaproteobacteria bacterium]